MIKRRLFACYLLFGLGMIMLIYSLNSMYMENYEVSSEGHIQKASEAPDPFPKGRPDYRKKHEEEKKQEEQRQQEEERQRIEQQQQQQQQQKEEAAKKKQDDEAEAKKLKEEKEKADKDRVEAQEKTITEQAAVQDADAKKKEIEKTFQKDASEKVIDEFVARSKTELTEQELALPIEKRVALRKQKYLAWMEEFNSYSDEAKKSISIKLQGRFLGMEHGELPSFKEKIKYTEEEKVDGKVQPAGKKIIMLTATDGQGNSEIQDVLTMALENRAEYANYHGYTNYFVNLTKFAKPNRHPVWNKINAIKEAFNENPEGEWLWWIDTDIIIMNPEIDIAEHILNKRALTERLTYGRPMRNSEANFMNGVYMQKGEVDINNIDLVICQDFFGLNAGSFFIKRSAFTNLLLDLWDDPMYVKAEFVRREQDALIHMFLNHPNVQEHVGLVPQRLLNSYSDKPEWVWTYVEGDFVIHFAGCNTRGRCDEIWKTNWSKRGRVPETFRMKNSFDEKASKVAPTESASATSKAAL